MKIHTKGISDYGRTYFAEVWKYNDRDKIKRRSVKWIIILSKKAESRRTKEIYSLLIDRKNTYWLNVALLGVLDLHWDSPHLVAQKLLKTLKQVWFIVCSFNYHLYCYLNGWYEHVHGFIKNEPEHMSGYETLKPSHDSSIPPPLPVAERFRPTASHIFMIFWAALGSWTFTVYLLLRRKQV